MDQIDMPDQEEQQIEPVAQPIPSKPVLQAPATAISKSEHGKKGKKHNRSPEKDKTTPSISQGQKMLAAARKL